MRTFQGPEKRYRGQPPHLSHVALPMSPKVPQERRREGSELGAEIEAVRVCRPVEGSEFRRCQFIVSCSWPLCAGSRWGSVHVRPALGLTCCTPKPTQDRQTINSKHRCGPHLPPSQHGTFKGVSLGCFILQLSQSILQFHDRSSMVM